MTRVVLRPINHLDIGPGHMAFGGPFAYKGSDSITVIDVSEPERARVIGRSTSDPALRALNVAACGKYVYAAAGAGRGFRSYDVSDPAAPALVAAAELPGQAGAIVAAADRVYIHGFAVRKGLDARFEYATYLSVVDVREPARPSMVHVDADGAWQAQIHEAYLYARCRRNTLGVFRRGGPDELMRVGRLAVRGGVDAMCLRYPYAHFALTRGEACIVDVSNPEKPKLLARYAIPGQPPIRTSALAVFDHYAIFDRRELGLHIVDFGDPTQPEAVGTYPLVLWMGGVYVHRWIPVRTGNSGRRACVPDRNRGLSTPKIGQRRTWPRTAIIGRRPHLAG
jgi:hypothetical protein